MASKVSIAIRRNAAIARIEEAIRALYGEDFKLPIQGRDVDLVHALQLEAIADRLIGAVESPLVIEPAFVTIASTELALNGVEPHVDPQPAKRGKGKRNGLNN